MNLWGTSSESSSLLCEFNSTERIPDCRPSRAFQPPAFTQELEVPLAWKVPPPALLPKSQQDLKERLTTPSSGKPSTTAQVEGVLCSCSGVQLVQTL